MQEVTEKAFTTEVLAASQTIPVVVEFWAPWCQPCKAIKQALQELQEEDSSYKVVTVNIDEAPAVAIELGIRGLPFLGVYIDNRLVATHQGNISKPNLSSWIKDQIR